MPEPCGCSSGDEASGFGVVCAEHALYPPDEVWAAARVLAANDPVHPIDNLDDHDDDVGSHYYCVAEEILLAAAEVRATSRSRERDVSAPGEGSSGA